MGLVFCVDDDLSVARLVADVVAYCGHEPVLITDSMEAILRMRTERPVAILADYMMPRIDGLEVLAMAQEQHPNVRRVLITAAPQEQAVRDAVTSGIAQMVIAKPPSIADIKMALVWL